MHITVLLNLALMLEYYLEFRLITNINLIANIRFILIVMQNKHY